MPKRPRSHVLLVAVAAFVLGSVLAADDRASSARAQPRTLTLEGSCDRGDVIVFAGSGRAECIDADRLAYPYCDSGEFLTTVGGQMRCVGPSSTPWGARGLLPECSNNAIVVSEGFGRWRCEDRR